MLPLSSVRRPHESLVADLATFAGNTAAPANVSAVMRAIGLSRADLGTLMLAQEANHALTCGEKFEPMTLTSERDRRLLWTALLDRHQHHPDVVERMVTGIRPDEAYLQMLTDWTARPEAEDHTEGWGTSRQCGTGPQSNWHAIVGASGAGKSTVGQLLAVKVGHRFIDLDTVVEAALRKPLAMLFATLGSLATLQRYSAVVEDTMDRLDLTEPAVVVFGAGSVLAPSVRAAFVAARTSTWIGAEPRSLIERIGAAPGHAARGYGDRGNLPLHTFVQLARSPIYALARRWTASRGTVENMTKILLRQERASA